MTRPHGGGGSCRAPTRAKRTPLNTPLLRHKPVHGQMCKIYVHIMNIPLQVFGGAAAPGLPPPGRRRPGAASRRALRRQPQAAAGGGLRQAGRRRAAVHWAADGAAVPEPVRWGTGIVQVAGVRQGVRRRSCIHWSADGAAVPEPVRWVHGDSAGGGRAAGLAVALLHTLVS